MTGRWDRGQYVHQKHERYGGVKAVRWLGGG